MGEQVDYCASFHRECPRRIIGRLHEIGEYRHYKCDRRYPGKVLCVHKHAILSDLVPTDLQAAFDRTVKEKEKQVS